MGLEARYTQAINTGYSLLVASYCNSLQILKRAWNAPNLTILGKLIRGIHFYPILIQLYAEITRKLWEIR